MKKVIAIILSSLAYLPLHASAQITINQETAVSFGLGDANLETTAVQTVQWVLRFLGLIAVIMILASIIIAATTKDSDRAGAAKKALIGAIVGLIIVLLAWAIVTFVVGTTTNVTS